VADATALRFWADAALSTASRQEGRFGMFVGNCIIVHGETVFHERCDPLRITYMDTATLQTCIDWLPHQGPAGLSALAASLFLFSIGFAVGWTCHHWERGQSAARY
jgi:hypothetical protein